ncbi:MAG: hypothetical protein ABSH52_24960, partial [Terriglobia bacterium]
NEVDPEGLEGFQGAEQVRHRPGEAIELPNNDGVETPAVCISHQAIQFGAVFFTTGNPDIHVFLGDRPAPALAEFAKFPQLHFRGLAVI